MVIGNQSDEVEDIVSMTSRLGVESEEDWEENEEAVASFGGRSVVGRIISKQEIKERRFTSIFTRLWKGISDWEVKVLAAEGDSIYVGVTLKSREDARIVVDKQPWIFNGGVLMLEDWPDTGQWRDAKLDKMYCWVRMKGIPLKAFTKKNVIRLAEMAGTLHELKWNNEQRMFLNGYVRARIGFPLQQSIFVGRFLPNGGHQHWVQFKFERLPLLCFKCGTWGHDQYDCNGESITVRGVDGLVVPKYGVWLKEEEVMPNCFIAFQQSRLHRNVDIDVRVDTEEAFLGNDGDRNGVSRTEMVTGSEPAAVSTTAGEAVIGAGVNGEVTTDRGTTGQENREAVISAKVVDYNQSGLRTERQHGLGADGPNGLGFNNSLVDMRDGSKCFQKRPVGVDELENDETDMKKRKNLKVICEEERDRARRGLEKGKQIVGEDLGCSRDGFAGFESGAVDLGSGAKQGQRRKISIKNRARNRPKTCAAGVSLATSAAVGEVGNQAESLNRVGGTGEFIFNAEYEVAETDMQKHNEFKESKLTRSQAVRLSEVLNFGTNVWIVDRIGLSGGLILMWQEELSVQVVSSSPGHIVAHIAGKDFLPWTLTGFYGHPEAPQRHFSWQLLRDIYHETQGPWLCVGDFNEIVSLSEKSGGRVRRSVAMEEFRKVLDECQLVDFCSVKSDFTWCNEHNSSQVMERALVVDIPCEGSGERCGQGRRKSRFHFEEAWCSEEECSDIVSTFWREGRAEASVGRILEDPWLPRPRSFKVYDKPYIPPQLKVVDLKLQDGEWDEDFIRHLFNHDDAEIILQLPVSNPRLEDKVLWHYSTNGEYSVRSAGPSTSPFVFM
ncbi:hypothetical protein G4B88_014537 [Cannabis sativa]|uniref:CCHC-type domain-containing protein n=1 Tax=Cannabis sativa TaxID=3483 RepID=A0A7J6IAJ6_CANSA|nr:hypothetical protein G4B88_014537 [Cannabis sativa]